jgi:hypothetical protein
VPQLRWDKRISLKPRRGAYTREKVLKLRFWDQRAPFVAPLGASSVASTLAHTGTLGTADAHRIRTTQMPPNSAGLNRGGARQAAHKWLQSSKVNGTRTRQEYTRWCLKLARTAWLNRDSREWRQGLCRDYFGSSPRHLLPTRVVVYADNLACTRGRLRRKSALCGQDQINVLRSLP